MVEGSNLSQDIKDNAKRMHHFNLAALAIGKKRPQRSQNPHGRVPSECGDGEESGTSEQPADLAARIALAQKQYDAAISELEQSNQQDPRNLYRLGQACQAKGDPAKAQDYYKKAAEFNSFPR